ncbi:phage tail protein [Sphingobium cloacae]|uniref:p2 phage tail completion R family protein n=1 Tax=Sphingobium cloacae TaxID=120107 RepID=A0A1E1F5K6_9SPHN|nr:phage tail protein [Sphingobium cloacae]BAV65762.1 P2 phage tail completion R family protein [Sphingobium cloacae]
MRKLRSLRAWLTQCLPDYAKHPDLLEIWAEEGRVLSKQSRSLSFLYGYTAKVGLWDFAGDPDHVMVPVLAWIEKEQPLLLDREDGAPFTFEPDLLDGDKCDLLLSIDLTERVLVKIRGDGSGYDLEHPPEPDLADRFEGVDARFLQGFGNIERLVESRDPHAVLTDAIPPDA